MTNYHVGGVVGLNTLSRSHIQPGKAIEVTAARLTFGVGKPALCAIQTPVTRACSVGTADMNHGCLILKSIGRPSRAHSLTMFE